MCCASSVRAGVGDGGSTYPSFSVCLLLFVFISVFLSHFILSIAIYRALLSHSEVIEALRPHFNLSLNDPIDFQACLQ
jgi:hypothetical protein